MFAGNHQILGTGKVDDLEVLTRAGLCDVLFVLSTEKIRTVIATVLPVLDTGAFIPQVRVFFGNKWC